MLSLVIGVKPGRCLGMSEDGKAVKLGLWAVEKKREELRTFVSLPALNRWPSHGPRAAKKTQAQAERQPILLGTTKPKHQETLRIQG